MKLKKGDTVKVISGKDKGQEGEIVHVYPADNKVLVNGINTAKKHSKARKANQQGGIIDRDMPVHASNVMLLDPKSNEPTRRRSSEHQAGGKKAAIPATARAISASMNAVRSGL